jgi:hypothetical protein
MGASERLGILQIAMGPIPAIALGLLLLAAVVGALNGMRKRFPHSLETHQQVVALGPISFLFTLYGFLLGFIVVNLWQTYDEARRTAMREAETLGILYRLTEAFPGAEPGREALLRYVRSVITEEWPAMAAGMGSPGTREHFLAIGREIRGLSPSNLKEQSLYANLLAQYDQLSIHRQSRLLLLEGSIPAPLWWALAAGGVLLLVGLYYMGIGTARHQLVIDGTAIGILLVTLYLAAEFDRPYSGSMKIEPTAFEKAVAWALQPDR